MPNWTYNQLVIDKNVPEAEFQELLCAVKAQPAGGCEESDSESRAFDFNTLIPMPVDLKIESNSEKDMAMLLVHIRDTWAEILIDCILRYDYRNIFRGRTRKQVQEDYRAICSLFLSDTEGHAEKHKIESKLDESYRQALKAVPFSGKKKFFARIYSQKGNRKHDMERLLKVMWRSGVNPYQYGALFNFSNTEEGAKLISYGVRLWENVRRYGAPTWYDWAIENWGTKWNACDVRLDEQKRTFALDTAWAPPMGIINALAIRFPNIDWMWFYDDEGYYRNVYVVIHEGGTLTLCRLEDAPDKALKAFVQFWGTENCLYQDTNGKWRIYDCGNLCPHYATCYSSDQADIGGKETQA